MRAIVPFMTVPVVWSLSATIGLGSSDSHCMTVGNWSSAKVSQRRCSRVSHCSVGRIRMSVEISSTAASTERRPGSQEMVTP